MGQVALESVVQSVNELPSLPQVVLEVMRLTRDPNTSARELNDVICQDQAITANMLRLANSAYYGFPRLIGTVGEAVVLLGFQTVRSIILTAAMGDTLSKEVKAYSLEKGELWKHSIGVATAGRMIAKRTGYKYQDLAYTAGLLHDVGKIVLADYLEKYCSEVMEKVNSDEVSFADAEFEILGIDHAQTGGEVAKKWNFPAEIVEAINFHHTPDLAVQDPKLTAITHVADIMCTGIGIGIGIDGLLYQASGHAVGILELDEKVMEEIVAELIDVFTAEDTTDN
ncbi:hd domain protein [hydrocarbon metagenome]|uniref:Hd domain protein n=1 Tax=hydrocarbon metagenome TaxID=938273 RepID=A0A0W8E7T7_9ZZZZ